MCLHTNLQTQCEGREDGIFVRLSGRETDTLKKKKKKKKHLPLKILFEALHKDGAMIEFASSGIYFSSVLKIMSE